MVGLARVPCFLAPALLAACMAPLPPTEEVRAGFGTVAVVTHETPPTIELFHSGSGSRGAGTGALRGVLGAALCVVAGGAAGAASGLGAVGAYLGIGVGVVAAAIYLPASTISAAATSLPSEDVEAARSALEQAFASMDTRPLGLRFLNMAAIHAQQPCLDGGVVSVGADGEEILPPWMPSADTIVVLRWERIRNGTTIGVFSLDAPCSLELTVELRLIRAADRALLHRARVVRSDPLRAKRFLEWSHDYGITARAEIDHALDDVCEALVEHVFLLDPGLEVSPLRRGMRATSSGSHGTTELRWSASGIEGASHDLRIYDEGSGNLVHSRDGITACPYSVSLPHGSYRWTVRLRTSTEHGPRVGPWFLTENSQVPVLQAPPPKDHMRRFEVD